jgi:hypothetical protein
MRAKKRAVPESSSKREGPDFQSGRKCHLTDSGFTVLKNSLLGGAALKAPRISPFFSFLAGLYPLQSVTKPPPSACSSTWRRGAHLQQHDDPAICLIRG